MEYSNDSIALNLDTDGYCVVPGVLNHVCLTSLVTELTRLVSDTQSAGVRDLARKCPAVLAFANSPLVRAIVDPIAGADARLVRSILFIKDRDTNWGVSWHQDLAIAVQERAEIDGYSGWSTKDGALHVQPPAALLETLLTVRLHLDPADESNGALIVSPGSHRLGRIPASEAADAARRLGSLVCNVQAGDALLLRPLVLHASSKSMSPMPRRVIHLEFTSTSLPSPLEWLENARL